VHAHKHTLLSRIYGLYKLKMDDTVSVFVIMGNVFNPTIPVHQRYDLKVRPSCAPATRSHRQNALLEMSE
jgi:hypothetical protein